MRLKTFTAASMPDAMRLIRDQLGEDAVIISTQEDAGQVRVTAAVDAPDELEWEDAARDDQGWDEPVDIEELLTQRLDEHGVPGRIAERLVRSSMSIDGEDPVRALAGGIDGNFAFHPLPEREHPRPIMFVGTPGSGKTVVLAKLATKAVMARKIVRAATTDTVKAGGVQQLASLMKVLKAPMTAANKPEDLAVFALKPEKKCLSLIDTAGINPFKDEELSMLDEAIRASGAEPVLVLAAGGDAMEAADTAEAFKSLGVKRMVVTRLDLARRLGFMFSAAKAGEMRFSHVSTAPSVAEGFVQINPMSMARLLLPDYAGAEADARSAQAFA
ncbi:MAG: hypothetical protein NXI16_15450 [Alphaproteobacteria bacterium]|nr:hypothetical protein [Alphaproteobacteria bacterium]